VNRATHQRLPPNLLASELPVHVRTLRAAARDGRLAGTFNPRPCFGKLTATVTKKPPTIEPAVRFLRVLASLAISEVHLEVSRLERLVHQGTTQYRRQPLFAAMVVELGDDSSNGPVDTTGNLELCFPINKMVHRPFCSLNTECRHQSNCTTLTAALTRRPQVSGQETQSFGSSLASLRLRAPLLTRVRTALRRTSSISGPRRFHPKSAATRDVNSSSSMVLASPRTRTGTTAVPALIASPAASTRRSATAG